MSKRRRSKKPNLPQATLDRAREQAGVEDTPSSDSGDANDSATQTKAQAKAAEKASRRRKLTPAQLERGRQKGEFNIEIVEELLANPTTIVSEEELRQEYGHVLADLRNMGILAGVLMILLVALAQFI